jgi:phage terminase small subunit|tara:strand:+ start:1347 stop:1991 length:645 start_codon:yes stop_codon:yes gene_type:complete
MGKIEMSNAALEPDEDILSNPKRYAIAQFKNRPLSKKQQKFVQLYVYHDLTNTECAHRAGYSHPAQVATTLLNDPRYAHIQEKVKELQEGEQKKYEITYEKVARDLLEIRNAAMEDGSYGAAVTAEMGRAKLAGLLIDKKEIKHGRIDQMDKAEVEARLQALIESNHLAPQLYGKVLQDEDLPGVVDLEYEDLDESEYEEYAEYEEIDQEDEDT